jgi:hypothetical protein
VARGRRRGYRTVLAPDFLTERDLHGVLSESSSGDDLAASRTRTIELVPDGVGAITVSYKTEQLSATDLNGGSAAGNAPPTDEHGRPLEILYGVVARGRLSGPVDGDDWEAARAEALRSYRRFLDEEDGFSVAASRSFALHDVVTAEPLQVDKDAALRAAPDNGRPAQSRRVTHHRLGPMGGLGLLATAAAIVIAIAWQVRPQPSRVAVGIAGVSVQPSSGMVDCAAPGALRLTGTIRSNGPATVTYHWEEGNSRAAPNAVLKFTGRGSRVVSFDALGPLGAARKGRYALVVDKPHVVRRNAPYDVQCRVTLPVSPSAPPPVG